MLEWFGKAKKEKKVTFIPPSSPKTSGSLRQELKDQLAAFLGRQPMRYAVDIGSYSVKVVAYKRSMGKTQLSKVEQIPFRERFDYTETEGRRYPLLREALEEFFLKPSKKTPAKISVTLPSSMTFIQRTKLPALKGKILSQAVEFEVKDKIPIPVETLVWDFMPLAKKEGTSRSVILAAVRKEVVAELFGMAQDLNLIIDQVGVGPAILYENLKRKISAKGVLLVLDLGAHTTDVIVITQDGFWSRTITFGGYKLMHSVVEAKGLSLAEAERQVIAEGLEGPMLKEILETKLEDLMRELKRTLTIYRQEMGEGDFNGLLLVGGLALLKGIEPYFTKALNLKSFKSATADLHVPGKPSEREVFFQAASLARTPETSINLLPFEERRLRAFQKFKVIFGIYSFLLILILLLGLWTIQLEEKRLAKWDAVLDGKISLMDYQKKKIEKTEQKLLPWAKLLEDARLQVAHKDLLLRVLGELDDIFPRSVWLERLEYDAAHKKLILQGRIREKLVGVERLKHRLEESPLLEKVDITAGTVQPDGTSSFSCSMEVSA